MKNEILRDYVNPENYKLLNYATACEDCTHFDFKTETCIFGYPTTPHLKRTQLADLEKNGMIAFCRTMETD
ncbi:MAG: hypothetical protein SGI74_08850 [Oligoflexia bacterium]|nr:hypothetical protein [Oligoflexia bacterium]